MSEDAPQLLEACPSCGTLIDVSGEPPFSHIHCPSCGQGLHARKQFNNFTLLDLIGQGGMGSVFKATDCNLNRQVALKILRREISGDAEEREKLAEEARRTATINHPHVVKVFNFGEDRGQFYLAMELVERGSLDDLMNLQGRVAEMQILEVGIQIASGLNAALECGLIHRDIKPGNILFADAHTAKLVDFGLALVADEAAAEKGEIWGTPYYIAPEKLDHAPEDFRSDIYSLGGTLFHALAGRPPYEAETASMVAIKQLKSKEVSLQAFAPEVSSETAYVINRMMKKNPDDRYESYDELISHFSYARQKLQDQILKPKSVASRRVVMESQQQRTIVGFMTLGLVALLVFVLIAGYLNRAEIASAMGINLPVSGAFNPKNANVEIAKARQLTVGRSFEDAVPILDAAAWSPDVPQPMKSWARLQLGLVHLFQQEPGASAAVFEQIRQEGLYSNKPDQIALAGFFLETARVLAMPPPIKPGTLRTYEKTNYEAFAYLLYGMKDWAEGRLPEAGTILSQFLETQPEGEYQWIAEYKPLVEIWVEDYRIYERLSKAAKAAGEDPAAAARALQEIRDSKPLIQTGGILDQKLEEMELNLETLSNG